MHRIALIGTGYVGLVTGACLSDLGNQVTCVDVDEAKIAKLHRCRMPLFEPGLARIVQLNRRAGRLTFSCDVAQAVAENDIIMIAVCTPVDADGAVDLSFVHQAARDIGVALNARKIVVMKSTVPVGTAEAVEAVIREHKTSLFDVTVVSNPEFLREGTAVADFMKPYRIVLGVSDASIAAMMCDLYAPLRAPIIVTDVRAAEMIKYAANAFLATTISFSNEIAALCERVGADVRDVVAGLAHDRRINGAYLNAGLGFGGSCLPKDLRALLGMGRRYDLEQPLLSGVVKVNARQIAGALDKLAELLGGLRSKRICLLGLAFKPGTDDVRESPAIALAQRLVEAGAQVVGHDPAAAASARKALGDAISCATDWREAVRGADAVVVATDWREYRRLNIATLRRLMAGRIFFDARNLYDPAQVVKHGLIYAGVGRRGEHVPSPLPMTKGKPARANGKTTRRRASASVRQASSAK